jgi:hypothetical protein
MTDFEYYSLVINALGVIAAIFIVFVAIWGERIRQKWNSPKLKIELDETTFNKTMEGIKGWYYRIKISNSKESSPANNVRLLLTKVFKKGPDGKWIEQKFSGPTQVMWQWPRITPLYLTIGPEQSATFASLLENPKAIELKLYWYPNNLDNRIIENDQTLLRFKAVSDTAESNSINVEVAWDGKWVEGSTEMRDHCIVKETRLSV